QVVEEHPGAVALAVAEPADAGGQALELDVLAGGVEPAMEVLVVREQLLQGPVGDCDVLGGAGQRHPAEGAEALAEQGTGVGARAGPRARRARRRLRASDGGAGGPGTAPAGPGR